MKPQVSAATDQAPAYVPALDGLRAVAAAMVLVLHLAGWTGVAFDPDGDSLVAEVLSRFGVAVHIFFVVSGFLLYRSYAAATLDGRPLPAATTYYWRRFLRIVPAYWVLVLATLLSFHREIFGDLPRLLRILTLQHIYVDGDFPHTPADPWSAFSQTWSLGTEASFYLLLPLAALLLHRTAAVRRGPGTVVAVFVCLEVFNLLWWTGLNASSYADGIVARWWWLPGYVAYFAAGMALAAVTVHAERGTEHPVVPLVRRRPWVCWAVALAAFAFLVTPLAGGHMRQGTAAQAAVEQLGYLIVSVGLALPLALAPRGGPGRLLSGRTVTWLGRISYGIFLWHMFVMAVALRIAGWDWGEPGVTGFVILLPLTCAVSVLFAWLSHVLVERPLQRRYRRRGRPVIPVPPDRARRG
ncbi:acyltransferase family protein [Streptomyces sp. NPDC002845]